MARNLNFNKNRKVMATTWKVDNPKHMFFDTRKKENFFLTGLHNLSKLPNKPLTATIHRLVINFVVLFEGVCKRYINGFIKSRLRDSAFQS